MNTQKKYQVLVIARKFNDIIYAVSCDEFQNASNKKLLIISQHPSDCFPLTSMFDETMYVFSPNASWKSQIRLLKDIYKISDKLKSDVILLSNIILFSHFNIVRASKCKNLIMLEDGYMNYRSDIFDNNWKKNLILNFMGFKKLYMKDKISITYLFSPENAKYYFGELRKLVLKSDYYKNYYGPNLNEKSIFVGQPLYHSNIDEVKEYNYIVNELIKYYNIEFYIPHFNASNNEKINCKQLNISKYGITLEALATYYNFKIYSFSSSLLFTTRIINPRIVSTMIEIQNYHKVLDNEIFIKNGVIVDKPKIKGKNI